MKKQQKNMYMFTRYYDRNMNSWYIVSLLLVFMTNTRCYVSSFVTLRPLQQQQQQQQQQLLRINDRTSLQLLSSNKFISSSKYRRPITWSSSSTRLLSSTIEKVTPTTVTTIDNQVKVIDINNDTMISSTTTTWECDDEVNQCVEVPICDTNVCRTSLDVRIHNTWYDLSGWRKAHPAGTHWIDWYDGRDATEVMDAFHSKKAQMMYTKLPKSNPNIVSLLSSTTPEDTPTQIAFRQLRTQLENDGWWIRDMVHEYKLLGIWGSLFVSSAILSHTVITPIIVPILLLSLCMTNAGWLGHDYIHGIDTYAFKMRNFAAIAAGLAPTWWSDKHNKHHALTNEMGVDEDIATDPFLYTWIPDPSQDSIFRKIQHYIFWIPFSFLFALWRVASIKETIESVELKRPNAKSELYSLLIHYTALFLIYPVKIWLPSIFLSGLISALIVTPTHQNEQLFNTYQNDWVTAQYQSTRNAIMTNPFSEWLWGGMQYQLEHHLFPSMPRSKYVKLRSIMKKFAITNQIPNGYRETSEFHILYDNWKLYKDVATGGPAIPGAPLTKGTKEQIGAIINTVSPTIKITTPPRTKPAEVTTPAEVAKVL